MQAMLLAAGLGTRLRPLTLERPKPAVPVANAPLAAYALRVLARAGFRRVVANAHHLAGRVEEALRASAPQGMELEVLHEDALLGTGGGLANAWRRLDPDEPVLVFNSDILFAPDLGRVMEAHRESGAVATMVLREDPQVQRYGAVELDAHDRVRRLLGVPTDAGAALRALMFTGVHVVDPRGRFDLPETGCIVRASYRRWVDRGDRVTGVVDGSPWRDLGTLAAYLDTNVELATGRLPWPGVSPEAQVGLVHATARLGAGVTVRASVIGAGASIADHVSVHESVVWDGAVVVADLRRAIATPAGVVEVS